MKITEPFLFWKNLKNGEMAWIAYEKMWRYVRSSEIQRNRIFTQWLESSNIKVESNGLNESQIFHVKKMKMEQVISDIHFLVICLEKVWKLANRLTGKSFCPELPKSRNFKNSSLKTFLSPYIDARDTFEHYDEQVLGGDPKKTGPGSAKISLIQNIGFTFGERNPINIADEFHAEFLKQLNQFDQLIFEELLALDQKA